MSSAGQRMITTTDAIANAPYTDYAKGQIIVDLATGIVYVSSGSAWVKIGAQAAA